MAVAELDDIALDVAQTDIPKSYEENRVDDFMAAGTRLIWVIDPERRRAKVHRPHDINEIGSLSGEDVLPGFSLPLAAILPKKA